jgi:hypothetical protein
MSGDLAMFVSERLAEDLKVADGVVFACRDSRQPWPPEQAPGRGGPALTEYLRHFSEQRSLRQFSALREILAYHTEVQAWPWPPADGDEAVQEAMGIVLRHLATIWSDHPDFRPEWKPQDSRESRQAAQNPAVRAGAPASGE